MSLIYSTWNSVARLMRSAFKKGVRKTYFEDNQKRDQELIFRLKKKRAVPSWRQLKYLPRLLSAKEILAIKTAVFLMLASFLTAGILVYQNLEETPAAGGEYVEAVVGAPTYANPLFAQANDADQDLTRLVFASLIKEDASGNLVGDLAESYTVDEKETTYTFTLKEGVLWHDKTPLTTRDIVFTIESIKDPEFKSPLIATFRTVSISIIDEQTFRLSLPQPYAPFLSVLTFGILPAHLWENIDPSHALLAELNLKPVGAGPYQFASLTKDKRGNILSYKLKKFDSYYEDGPFIENITLKFFASLAEAVSALESGNADGLGFLPQASLPSAAKSGGKSTYRLGLPQYTAIFFNQDSNPALSEQNVRLALALATSRQQIIDAVFPEAADAAYGPILPGMIGYSEEAPKTLLDPARAAELLDSAGWKRVYPEEPEDSGTLREEGQNGNTSLGLPENAAALYTREKSVTSGGKTETRELAIVLTIVQKQENILVAEEIRRQWRAIGVKVDINVVDIGQVQREVIRPRAYEALLFGQILGRDPDPYPFWHSSQANDPGLNLARYANKDVDKLLEDARHTANEDIRSEKYQTFQQKIAQDAPAIFLYNLDYSYVVPATIKGINRERISHPSDRFTNVNQWFVKTRGRINWDIFKFSLSKPGI